MQEPLIGNVSDTALWVAAYRADESDRPDALFKDPQARALAGDRGAEMARRIRHPAVRIGVVLRTALIDEAIEAEVAGGGCDIVLNLGAGLDTRPFRLDLPSTLRWIEVDMPELLEYKRIGLANDTPRCAVQSVGLDLADRGTRRSLLDDLGCDAGRTLVLTEGLLGYLAAEEVGALAEDLRELKGCVAWLTDIVGANVVSSVRNAGDDLKAESARVVFAPPEGTAFFERFGWRETAYHDIFTEAPRLGRDSFAGKAVRAFVRLLPEERRKRFERGMGVARFEPVGA